ncbi:uncharacterized protein LOC110445335 [Mizuhopecten yessoensis]|uniref:uncharacterized protein LOC110445335 n=1 Tax=Mizuhopecten yessoensis TaxID=6573 RepID=UPI000B45A293|nr:uncharacterized protein LOC110445335 [Mizuhopecten yessoensis]
MDRIKQTLAVSILVVSCLTLAFGASIKETTQRSPVTMATPKQDHALDHVDLMDSLQGYRINGVTPYTCAQIGGMFILYNCIIITPASDMKPTGPRNNPLGG